MTAAVGVLCSIGLAAFVLARASRQAAWVPAVASPDAPAPRANGVPREVTLRFEARPQGARLFLDGEPLPENPYERSAPIDGTKHWVRAELDGHLSALETFTQDSDVALLLTLPPEPEVAAKSSGHRGAPTAESRRPKPASSASARACDVPFYMGTDGIRHILPGCM